MVRSRSWFGAPKPGREGMRAYGGNQANTAQLNGTVPVQESIHIVTWVRSDENRCHRHDQDNRQPRCNDSPH